MWVGDRIWFVSDHAYWGNLYSVAPDGSDLQRHTDHEGFFVRHPHSDGQRVVYGWAGDLWGIVPGGAPERFEIEVQPAADQTRPRFIDPKPSLQGQDLHPNGKEIALEIRGRPFCMAHWEGAVTQLGARDGVRHRLIRWIPQRDAVVLVSDEGGEERLEIHSRGGDTIEPLAADVGRPIEVVVAPSGRWLALTNHRGDVYAVDLADGSTRCIDRCPTATPTGLDWSADSRWLAWSHPGPRRDLARIRTWDSKEDAIHDLTDGRSFDWCPSWDPDGKLLYFLARRDFDPVYDAVYFDLNFPRASRPWAVTLQRDTPHPFRPVPRAIDAKPASSDRKKRPPAVVIDLEDLPSRTCPMPVKESCYQRILAIAGGGLLMSRRSVAGSLDRRLYDPSPPKTDHALVQWDPDRREVVTVDTAISDFGADVHRRSLWVQCGWRLRVLSTKLTKGAREALRKERSQRPGRRSGWLDLGRVRCPIDPRSEWRQILHESWRMMRDHFWTEDMSGVDWEACRARYAPLVERVSTREELSDLVWCLQGELGTSHAYEMGGDRSKPPRWAPGRLAADVSWSEAKGGWRLDRICRGDPGRKGHTSPLAEPGVNAIEGERILAIDGVTLTRQVSPEAALAHRADRLVTLQIADAANTRREVVVRALRDERPARYRDWVRRNREEVFARTEGRCGYVHIPDMGPNGYATFHRDFLVESTREGLVVDVRFNRGGHVSQLLLEKLARRPLGWSVPRWLAPTPYPTHAMQGPMICLTNEYSSSDGDIFSHNWKQLGLGPLVGRRTWGGVIGVWPRHRLVDRSMTTQPEFSNWFVDVGWTVENYGTDPDVDIDIAPQDHAAGHDPQLDHALTWMNEALDASSAEAPRFDERPYLGPPRDQDPK